jgi:hypothetical protein
MGRWATMLTMALTIFFGLAGSASAATYYIAANGSDSNGGTSNSSPWLHAPGMSTCTGTCKSTTIKAGDSIIFRGGDSWHFGNSSDSPFAGSGTNAWNLTANGSSSTCQLLPMKGAIQKTGCIYVGVDQTWYNSSVCGSTWCRPILNFDNALSTSAPASCSYDDSYDNSAISFGTYTIVDDFEIEGACWSSETTFATLLAAGAGSEITDSYAHGWTMASPCAGSSADCDELTMFATGGREDHDVVDGSDSTYGNLSVAQGNATGEAFWPGSGEFDHNVINHASNGIKYAPVVSVHDNLFENMSEPSVGGTHGNVVEWEDIQYSTDTYFYNNILLATAEGETIDMYPGSSKAGYIFNNVQVGPNDNATNCYMIEGDQTPGRTYFFNNTTNSPCLARGLRGSSSASFQNNHMIGYSGVTVATSLVTDGSLALTDSGNEIYQSESTADGQGYMASNDDAPTSESGATIHAGANLSSLCGGMDNSEAASACASGIQGVTEQTGQGGYVAADNPVPPTRSPAWDAGAYQFGGETSNQPAAPTSLVATIQ